MTCFGGTEIEGLIAHYPLDGDAKDWSANSSDGRIVGAKPARGVNGKAKTAYKFNGETDYIHLPININPSRHAALTMTLWVNAEDLERRQLIISNDDGRFDRSLRLTESRLALGWTAYCGGNKKVLGSEPTVKNEWVFLAVVYDQEKATVDLYVNGNHYQKTEAKIGRGLNFVSLGSSPTTGRHFKGRIDNVRIFDRALSTNEIATVRGLGQN